MDGFDPSDQTTSDGLDCLRSDHPADVTSHQRRRARELTECGLAQLLAGKPMQAEDYLRRSLDLDEQSAEALNLLATALRRQNNFKGAVSCYQRALHLAPHSNPIRINMALAQRAQNNLLGAAATCREVLRDDRTDPAAWNALALILQAQGDITRARTAFCQAVKLAPSHPDYLCNFAHLLAESGESEDSRLACRRALELDPGCPEAWVNLSHVLALQGHHEQSIAAGRRALALRHPFPLAALNLALELRRLGGLDREREALILLSQAIESEAQLAPARRTLAWEQMVSCLCNLECSHEAWLTACHAQAHGIDSLELLAQMGRALALCERFQDAQLVFEAALRRRAQHPPAHVAGLMEALGALQWMRGQGQAACASFAEAVACDPERWTALRQLVITQMNLGQLQQARETCQALLQKAASDSENLRLASQLMPLADCEALLDMVTRKTRELEAEPPASLIFAAAHLEHRLHKVTAFTTLLEANRLHQKQQKSLPSPPSDDPDQLLEIALGVAAMLGSQPASDSQHKIIFIVGLPRCGSTLVESILQSCPSVRAVGEINALDHALHHEMSPDAVSDHYIQRILDRLGHDVKPDEVLVDKQLGNYPYINIMHTIFPRAKVIHVFRNPMDQILSIFQQRFGSRVEWAYDLDRIVQHYHCYRQVIVRLAANSKSPVYQCNYDHLVRQPEPEIARLLKFCELPWDDACLTPERQTRMVTTASTLQVRQPIHSHSVGRWRTYEAYLKPWEQQLRGLGYLQSS